MGNVIIKLGFKIGFANGQAMNIDIVSDEHNYTFTGIDKEYITHTFKTAWPVTIKCNLSNKDMSKDSYFNDDGTPIENKYVQLDYLSINNFPLLPHNLYHVSKFKNSHEIFWDTNDIAIINLTGVDPVSFLLSINNPLTIN
jgi:hypothetical protein